MVLALSEDEQISVMSGINIMANAVVATSVANSAIESISAGTSSAFESISLNIYSFFSSSSNSSSSDSSSNNNSTSTSGSSGN